MEFAKRLDEVKPSATFKYAALAKKPGVINLTIGRPDFDTPDIVKNAAKDALDDGKVHYTPSAGIVDLRERICKKLTEENKIPGLDKDAILVSGGAKSVLFQAMMCLIGENDVVAIPNPSWVSYEAMIKLAGGSVDWLPLKPEKGFIPDDDFFNALENSPAKLLIINSPNNPTGAVYPNSIFEKIVDICKRSDIVLISDECYESLIYEGEHFSPASIYDKTITVNAFSKAFSMTGWRVGYAASSDKDVIKKMGIIHGQSLSCCTSFAQYGALACFTKDARAASKKMLKEYKKRRDFVMGRIKELDVVCEKPSGAFYAFPFFNGWDDLELADKLIEGGVGTVPGSPFGSQGKGCIRISFGSGNITTLGEAFNRIEKTLGK